ncbi:TetR family transcriptional regulator [Paenibacillus helianthi]|uniref:TetR family transcriptional regulator n=1 Tax=Paenibacillus helianthi TaxID=1349432 RepID=A0ABX3ES27_9BACL|nr:MULTISPECIES: TetR/AcrR family transcriptional regulator [Paenibacillus]OKP90357.1 TetR family transcriptional regulator [Paenibacillus sp. P32E]OKP90493.1 TetR family transcriptional regulator [Paenibacillus helianthi]
MLKNKPLTSRQLQSIQTKSNLFESAVKLMKQHSLEDITIAEICRGAGVSVGSFYNYFSTKSDILVEMYEQADGFFDQKFRGLEPSASIQNDIVDYFKIYAEYNLNVGIATIKQLYTCNNKLFIAKGRYMQNVLQALLEKGQANRQLIDSMSAEEMTEYLFIAARGVIYNWCLHEGGYDLERKMEEYMARLVVVLLKVPTLP